MNVDFCLYDDNGKIIKTGHCPKECIPSIEKYGYMLLIGFANQKTQKIINDVIVDKTPEEIEADKPLKAIPISFEEQRVDITNGQWQEVLDRLRRLENKM